MKRKDGGYIDVSYVEGAVLVNLGALMQMWTGDKYPATVSSHTNIWIGVVLYQRFYTVHF